MSVDSCKFCGSYVDTDFDPECYIEVPSRDKYKAHACVCESCREKHTDEDGNLNLDLKAETPAAISGATKGA